LEVGFPYDYAEKEARQRGLTVDELIHRFSVIAEYNGFEGVLLTLVEDKPGKER